MTRLTANNLSPRVRKFARFANAFYQAGTVAQANRLLDYATTQDAPGFAGILHHAGRVLAANGLRNPLPFVGERLPRPQPGDNALLPADVRVELARHLARTADEAYGREDISAIARGDHATPFGVHKKGRTIFDQHGRALCRVLLPGADASVYRCLATHWTPDVDSEPVLEDDFL